MRTFFVALGTFFVLYGTYFAHSTTPTRTRIRTTTTTTKLLLGPLSFARGQKVLQIFEFWINFFITIDICWFFLNLKAFKKAFKKLLSRASPWLRRSKMPAPMCLTETENKRKRSLIFILSDTSDFLPCSQFVPWESHVQNVKIDSASSKVDLT